MIYKSLLSLFTVLLFTSATLADSNSRVWQFEAETDRGTIEVVDDQSIEGDELIIVNTDRIGRLHIGVFDKDSESYTGDGYLEDGPRGGNEILVDINATVLTGSQVALFIEALNVPEYAQSFTEAPKACEGDGNALLVVLDHLNTKTFAYCLLPQPK